MLSRHWAHCLMVVSLASHSSPLYALDNTVDFGARARLVKLQENDQHGQAGSLALRLSWQTKWSENFHSLIQLDHVNTAWQDRHSDGVRFNHQPRIPDVPGTEFNQLFLAYEYSDVTLRVGRQMLAWDNQRFISSNGFWQNPQSFDALTASFPLAAESLLQYAYLHNANRIFGDSADKTLRVNDVNYIQQKGLRPRDGLGDHAMHSHLLHARWADWDYSEITAFGYFINNETLPSFSHYTVGVNYGYQRKMGLLNYRLTLAAARQQRPTIHKSYDLPYWQLTNAIGFGRFDFSLDYEYLGANGRSAVITPLGFTHEFQGWGDRFVTTPANGGVEDISLRNTSRFGNTRMDLRYHHFYEAHGGSYYGREVDAELSYQFAVDHKLALRYAKFNSAVDFRAQLKNINNVYVSWAYRY